MKINIKERKSINVKEVKTISLREIRNINLVGGDINIKRLSNV